MIRECVMCGVGEGAAVSSSLVYYVRGEKSHLERTETVKTSLICESALTQTRNWNDFRMASDYICELC